MPTHDSLGPDDGYGVKNARAATIEPDEQSAVGPTQMQSAWCALLEDIELMPQHQDFGFRPSTRLEAVAQHTDEEKGHCDHQPQSCSDSLAAVTPADPVFGSDTGIRSLTERYCDRFGRATRLGILPRRLHGRGGAAVVAANDAAPTHTVDVAHAAEASSADAAIPEFRPQAACAT
jgi:hypothetical protein